MNQRSAMKPHETQLSTDQPAGEPQAGYSPPTVMFLGTLSDLTQQKEVGAADGETFLGLDIGS